MTKAELERDRNEWKQQAESLQEELDALNEAYYEMESQLNDALYDLEGLNAIWDVDDFKSRLFVDNLLTPELEEFIAYYIQFHNTRPD